MILKAREPARTLVVIGDKDNDSPRLEYKQRWVNQFNLYLNHKRRDRMFLRMCPYFPFSARICLNQHHWLAIRMTEEGVDFQQSTNAFLRCANRHVCKNWPTRSPHPTASVRSEVARAFAPFITDRERRQAGYRHRLFFSQVGIATTQTILWLPHS